MTVPLPAYYTYAIYTLILAVTMVVLVPRVEIRRLLIYGITFGAVADASLIFLLSKLVGVGGHINHGPFGALGLPFFPPLAWSIWFVLFLYFLPRSRWGQIIYVLAAAFYSVLFSNILANFHIFNWNYGRVLVPLLIYGSWFSAATWAYLRLEPTENDRDNN